jgi:hypothetical protein
MNTRAKSKISELLVILGTVLFVGGAICYMAGHLPAEHISGLGAQGETVSRRGENGKQKTFYGVVSAEFDAEYSP